MNKGIAMMAAMIMAAAEGKQCYGDVYRSNRKRSAEKNFRLARMAQTIRRKEESKELRTFNIGGEKIEAYSRKDAIQRLKHRIKEGKR